MYHPQHTYDYTIADLQRRIAIYEDSDAYKQLFFKLFPLLQNFAFAITKNRPLSEEIASDAMMEVWARRAKLLDIDDLKMYLYVSVRNAALRKLKQEKNVVTLSIYDIKVEFLSDYVNPEEEVSAFELKRKIDTAIIELPPKCQMIYKLAKEDKMKYKDIASLLNISIKTIDAQLAIALKRIAEAIHYRQKKGK